jgi:UDP-3-O-[3-hydroxymyristoyl] glucosamine N-acyltransferase
MLQSPSKYSLAELADRFQLELHGDGKKTIEGVGTLKSATPAQLSFLANPGYRGDLPATRAGAVILRAEDAAACPTNYLLASDPYLAYARLATVFTAFSTAEPGIHPSAVIDASASIGEGACIGPQVFIGARCDIGPGCRIGPGSVIEADSQLGGGCLIHANVSIGQRVRLGQRVIVHAGAVLGADGFGFAFAANHWEKVPQLGGIRIGDDCEIGANTTIDRGAIDDTVLEEDVKIDNLVQIAHNVHIGAHTAIAGMAGIAGSSRIGRYCLLAGQSGVSGHVDIADHVTLGAHSVAHHSIEEAGSTWSGLVPAQVIRQWQRNLSYLRKLDQLARRLKILEKRQGKPSKDE